MRKFMIMVVLAAMCVIGCDTPLPSGVKGALYTAQLSLEQSAKNAKEATKDPWKIDVNETTERKLAKTEQQVIELLKIMSQADENLKVVVDYFRTDKKDNNE